MFFFVESFATGSAPNAISPAARLFTGILSYNGKVFANLAVDPKVVIFCNCVDSDGPLYIFFGLLARSSNNQSYLEPAILRSSRSCQNYLELPPTDATTSNDNLCSQPSRSPALAGRTQSAAPGLAKCLYQPWSRTVVTCIPGRCPPAAAGLLRAFGPTAQSLTSYQSSNHQPAARPAEPPAGADML